MTQYLLTPGLISSVQVGGVSVLIASKNMTIGGGYIVNPLNPIDQNIHIAESLFVNVAGQATIGTGHSANTELMPGETFIVPPGCVVWVNAATSGHRFTAVFVAPYSVQYPPSPVPGYPGSQTSPIGSSGGPFPPPGPTGLLDVIPSYLYQEYSDDDDLQAFVASQNEMQQNYVDTFNALNLPIYPGPIVSGKLLDWVGQGVYGMARPAIGSGVPIQVGPLNTWGCNMPGMSMAVINEYYGGALRDTIPASCNGLAQLSVGDVVITDDDTYRRILTWHFFKGDGKYFDTRWLKRRVWRFCFGENGWSTEYTINPLTGVMAFISDTEQISVTLGTTRNCTIRFVLGIRTITSGEMLNVFGCNGFGVSIGGHVPGENYEKVIPLDALLTIYKPLPPLPFMDVFKKSVDTGALELPYQYNYTVHIG
jgi:hypothetical protein